MSVHVWGQEFLQAIGNFFMSPLLYYTILYVIGIAIIRIKKERKQFSVKIYDQSLEFQMIVKQGIVIGLVLSVLTLLLGVTIPTSFIWTVSIGFFLLSLTGMIRIFSTTYLLMIGAVVGIGLFCAKDFMPEFLQIDSLREVIQWNVMPLFTILLFAEAFLVGKFGGKKTSPDFVKGSRGGRVGVHIARKLWIVPLFLLIPAGEICGTFTWWPVFGTGADSYTLCLLPIPIGYGMVAKGFLPEALANQYAKIVYQSACLGVLASIATYFFQSYAWSLFLVVALYYLIFTTLLRWKNSQKVSVFSRQNGGITILEVLQHTPADLMEIQKGEMIVKANGEKVESMVELYDVLSRNRAYVKLEVRDKQKEIRQVHRSFHEGDHHELGIIAIEEECTYESLLL